MSREKNKRYKDKKFLEQFYVERLWAARDIGAECGVSKMTILRWLRKHGIPIKIRGGGTGYIEREKRRKKRGLGKSQNES